MRKVCIIGDYNPQSETHLATDKALLLASTALDTELRFEWISTKSLPDVDLASFSACIVNTGVYENRTAVIDALRILRESNLPTLATCGGFQYMIIEYARNVLGLENIGHAEFDSEATQHLITPLSCSLRGLEGEISLVPDSLVGRVYGATRTTEKFYCSFGLNPSYRQALSEPPLHIVGTDSEGQERVAELANHPFYIGTLFVPQARALKGESHPLVDALIAHAVR